jgi:hypothetical protein
MAVQWNQRAYDGDRWVCWGNVAHYHSERLFLLTHSNNDKHIGTDNL